MSWPRCAGCGITEADELLPGMYPPVRSLRGRRSRPARLLTRRASAGGRSITRSGGDAARHRGGAAVYGDTHVDPAPLFDPDHGGRPPADALDLYFPPRSACPCSPTPTPPTACAASSTNCGASTPGSPPRR